MLKIETWPNNHILRTVCDPISKPEFSKYVKLWKEMIKYIKDPENGGIGLAAPQVGVTKRLIVISLIQDRKHRDDEDIPYPTIMMINPEIIDHGNDTEIDEEWCLSLPGMRGEVERYVKIKVKFLDDKWKTMMLLLEWLPARIVQHEVDHINGVLFIDKLKNLY